MTSEKKMEKNKKQVKHVTGRSYLKIFLIMMAGAVVGATLSVVAAVGYETVANGIRQLLAGIGQNGLVIMGILLAAALLMGIGSYIQVKKLGEELRQAEERDQDADALEYRLDSWGGKSMVFGYVVIIAAILQLVLSLEQDVHAGFLLGLFILIMIVQSVQQIRLIRLIQTIDPRMQGDPGDFDFQKEWLHGCDEAERQKIYKSAYKTQQFMGIFIMVALVVTVLCHMTWNTGLMAVIMVAVLGIAQTVASYMYTMELERNKRRG
ncbi:MAG TPA: DUF3169 family protein [Candidatus Blautia gallistercoris]|uniref:DUF3169 family protein n=1 Tax=Candidatus Blautia gallistercoris TaxID=2838490 RepID=A0A9D2B388_9FIRM|nr:DUF3169 family protein [Candidatus Blautia gallistercoris]